MQFLIRFVQIHETFRKPEIEALALLANVSVDFLHYSENVGFNLEMHCFHIERSC